MTALQPCAIFFDLPRFNTPLTTGRLSRPRDPSTTRASAGAPSCTSTRAASSSGSRPRATARYDTYMLLAVNYLPLPRLVVHAHLSIHHSTQPTNTPNRSAASSAGPPSASAPSTPQVRVTPKLLTSESRPTHPTPFFFYNTTTQAPPPASPPARCWRAWRASSGGCSP